jgi:hypothetical protein
MRRFGFLIGISFLSASGLQAQVTMDLELKAAYTINGPKYLFSDNVVFFDLNDGFAYGVNFDLRFKPTVALSFGHIYSQSSSTLRHTFSQSGFDHNSGVLKDRIFDLGIKKYFPLKRGISLAAFVGIFTNFYKFEHQDISVNSSITTTTTFNSIESDSYVRFNKLTNAAIGPKLGFYFEKNFSRIGRFIIGISYGFELTKGVERVISAEIYEFEKDLGTNQYTELLNEDKYITHELTRNPFMIEIGFRMPGAMILKEKKKEIPESME